MLSASWKSKLLSLWSVSEQSELDFKHDGCPKRIASISFKVIGG